MPLALLPTLEVWLRLALLAAEALLVAPMLYLLLLSVAATLGQLRTFATGHRRRAPAPAAELPRFVALMPAHDEAAVIGEALASIRQLDYPRDRYRLVVVADNCTDETASLARAAGAVVFERTHATQRSKGYALRYALEQLAPMCLQFDAYVIVDADSSVSANFLREMAGALAQGAQVVQARYDVVNAHAGSAAALRAVAFALFNYCRPLGRSALGWSAGLKGNGMCFRREIVERFGWGAYSLAEDAEYHATLVQAGIHVAFLPTAVVSSAMPTTVGQSGTQQARWERGRIELTRRAAPALCWSFLRRGDFACLDAAAELTLPPISLLAVAVAMTVAGAALLGWPPTLWLAGALAVALAFHVVAGVLIAQLPARTLLALLVAPFFVLWKSAVYITALFNGGKGRWVRTPRGPKQSAATTSPRS